VQIPADQPLFTFSILFDDNFPHSELGIELKKARDRKGKEIFGFLLNLFCLRENCFEQGEQSFEGD
jgi:hypothetical protein